MINNFNFINCKNILLTLNYNFSNQINLIDYSSLLGKKEIFFKNDLIFSIKIK